MKKVILIVVLAISMAALPVSHARAGEKEWATAGKILTGVIGLSIIADAVAECAEPGRVYGSYGYSNTRYSRGYSGNHHRKHSRRYDRHCSRNNTWVPGHYRVVREKVWVPGTNRRVWVPAFYEWRWRRGRKMRVCVRDGYYRYEKIPGHYEWVDKKIWVEGCWQQVA